MNGWKNWETWNVAMWISNDRRLYGLVLEYLHLVETKRVVGRRSWGGFCRFACIENGKTPDGAKYLGRGVSKRELGDMLRELQNS